MLLGREVALGSGYADLVGVESSGRPVVIEVKLARNAEARRAVVAQALAYAAYLHGLSPGELERDVLGAHLARRGFASLAAAVRADDQAGEFDAGVFTAALAEHLSVGSARIVFVLDSAPPELVRLVGYLEAIAPSLTQDEPATRAAHADGADLLRIDHLVAPRAPCSDGLAMG